MRSQLHENSIFHLAELDSFYIMKPPASPTDSAPVKILDTASRLTQVRCRTVQKAPIWMCFISFFKSSQIVFENRLNITIYTVTFKVIVIIKMDFELFNNVLTWYATVKKTPKTTKKTVSTFFNNFYNSLLKNIPM